MPGRWGLRVLRSPCTQTLGLHTSRTQLPAFVRPAGRSREKVHSDWPHVPCLWPLCRSLGPWKYAWNKPPGPWWSWSVSPNPRHPGFASPGAYSGLRLFLGWEGRLALGHLCPPAAVPCPHESLSSQCLLWESHSQETTSDGLALWRTVPGEGRGRGGGGAGEGDSGGQSGAHCFSLPDVTLFSPTLPIPTGAQKHTPTIAAPHLCFGSSLVPEAATDTLFIVLTPGLTWLRLNLSPLYTKDDLNELLILLPPFSEHWD